MSTRRSSWRSSDLRSEYNRFTPAPFATSGPVPEGDDAWVEVVFRGSGARQGRDVLACSRASAVYELPSARRHESICARRTQGVQMGGHLNTCIPLLNERALRRVVVRKYERARLLTGRFGTTDHSGRLRDGRPRGPEIRLIQRRLSSGLTILVISTKPAPTATRA
jgi:hypothetical protein